MIEKVNNVNLPHDVANDRSDNGNHPRADVYPEYCTCGHQLFVLQRPSGTQGNVLYKSYSLNTRIYFNLLVAYLFIPSVGFQSAISSKFVDNQDSKRLNGSEKTKSSKK